MSDADLVDLANGGDVQGFEELYLRYRDWVVSLGWRFTGDRDDSLDILQDTFAWLMSRFPGFELRAQMKTVLYPVVRSLAITQGRRRRVAIEHGLRIAGGAGRADEGEASEGEERRQVLDRIVAELPEIHREVLILRFVDGLSLEEIGIALELPTGTVKSRLHHALATLREHEITRKYFLE